MLRYPYSVTDPKKFLKAPSATICTKFEGGGAPKKRDFLVKIFQKMPFCHVFFFKILPAAHNILPKQSLLYALGELVKAVW